MSVKTVLAIPKINPTEICNHDPDGIIVDKIPFSKAKRLAAYRFTCVPAHAMDWA